MSEVQVTRLAPGVSLLDDAARGPQPKRQKPGRATMGRSKQTDEQRKAKQREYQRLYWQRKKGGATKPATKAPGKPQAASEQSATICLSGRQITVAVDAAGGVTVKVER